MKMILVRLLIIFWAAYLSCAVLSENKTESKVTVSLTVQAQFPGTTPFKLYNVQYENGNSGVTSYAKTSAMFFDDTNYQKRVNRVNTWYFHSQTGIQEMDCTTTNNFRMTPVQITYTGYTGNQQVWDRGHLTPTDINLFEEDHPMKKTHSCVNVSPQDPYSNRCVWKYIEKDVGDYLKLNKKVSALIITGISTSKISGQYGTTLGGYGTPQYFWKVICYMEGINTYVVGFKIENTLIQNKNSTIRKQRLDESKITRSQADIITLIDSASMQNAWNGAKDLIRSSNLKPVPDVTSCNSAKSLPAAVKLEWDNYMKFVAMERDSIVSFDNEECSG